MKNETQLPEGYYSRDRGRLALCIKVYRTATADEVRSVGEELDAYGGKIAPASPIAKPTPWGDAWGDAWNRHPDYHEAEQWALESAHEYALEHARELFGPGVELYTDGRSGGWLVLHGEDSPGAEQARTAVEIVSGECRDIDGPEEIEKARALLANLETFRQHVAAAVADFPRAVAWQVCANVFLPAAEEHARTVALDEARARLEHATRELRYQAEESIGAAEEQLATGEPNSLALRIATNLHAVAVAEYDAALAEVTRLQGEGGTG